MMQTLFTSEGENLSGTPWEEYPRPQLRRKDWLCLNGTWEFSVGDEDASKIRVPFCPESILSQYQGRLKYGAVMLYRKSFQIPKDYLGKRLFLHFGAVSNVCDVIVNGRKVCAHENGYLSFTADITQAINPNAQEENVLEVRVINDLSGRIPMGKQKEERGGMWYTPVSGIWQSVWLEPVSEEYITNLTIKPDLTGVDITFHGIKDGILTCEDRRYEIHDGHVRINPENPRLWSPETPYLYEFSALAGEDQITSYFALRTMSVETLKGIPRLCLNGKPYFFHGLLDQGYFSDGIYTPAMPGAYEKDILAAKGLGFNMLRKHIKIEPEQFYYDCDRLGMIVFQDMVNNGDYRFLRDTLLPTFGFRRAKDARMHADQKTREAFLQGMEGTVMQLYNHPCICLWTIFNEGWGQFDADGAYDSLRTLDDSRIIDSTSGWFHQKKSDVDSRHMYFEKLHLGNRRDLPQVLSEFGGYVYKVKEHSCNQEKTYGYKIFKTREEFAAAFRRTYLEDLVPLAKKGLCASVFTQISDVEDETNGLLTYDRKVCKLNSEEVAGIYEKLQEAVQP